MTEFTPGQTATVAHEAIKSALEARDKAEHCSLLWFAEILKRKLYRELGYSSIKHYAMSKLGFSKSQFYGFQNLCLQLEKLPIVKQKIESGELGYTKAQALLPVIDQTNEKEWAEFAEEHSRRDLQEVVKQAKKQAEEKAAGQPSLIPVPKKLPPVVVPVNVNLKMSPTQFARYEKLWEQVRKRRNAPADKIEAMLAFMEFYVAGNSIPKKLQTFENGKSEPQCEGQKSSRLDNPVLDNPKVGNPMVGNPTVAKPPIQIHIHKCPECAAATVQTSKGELQLSETELERALCDCQISQPNQRNTTSIPPAIRRKVFARARNKCQCPGCDHTGHLEIHHIVPRSKGGTNDAGNLICLCSGCHKLIHESKLDCRVMFAREPRATYQYQQLGNCNVTPLKKSSAPNEALLLSSQIDPTELENQTNYPTNHPDNHPDNSATLTANWWNAV